MSSDSGTEIWKEAPILKGTTKFEPLPDVRNILVTGGQGFMYVPKYLLSKDTKANKGIALCTEDHGYADTLY